MRMIININSNSIQVLLSMPLLLILLPLHAKEAFQAPLPGQFGPEMPARQRPPGLGHPCLQATAALPPQAAPADFC